MKTAVAFWTKCECCGKVFMTNNTERLYCGKNCKSKASYHKLREKKYKTVEEKITEDLKQTEAPKPKRVDLGLVAVHCSSGMFWTTKENARNLKRCWVYEDDVRLSI